MDGRIQPGDRLLAVNDESLSNLPYAIAVSTIGAAFSGRTPLTSDVDLSKVAAITSPSHHADDKSSGSISLVVERPGSGVQTKWYDQEVTVDLVKKPGRGLGLCIVERSGPPVVTFNGVSSTNTTKSLPNKLPLSSAERSGLGVIVCDLIKGSTAQLDGRIMIGDQILAINEVDVENDSQESVATLLKSKLSNGFDSWPKSKLSNGFDSWPFGYVVECHSKLSNGFDSWPVGNGFDSWPVGYIGECQLCFSFVRALISLPSPLCFARQSVRQSAISESATVHYFSLVRALSSLHLEVLNSLCSPVGYVGECHCFSFVRALISLHIELEQWRIEAKREKDLRKRLEVEVKNRDEKMARIEADMKRLTLSNEDLGRQLDVAMVS
ncbi:unnamed protein product [Rodentolepis nana]|uniref:PDZ domain-containing protein n=1 Tax=Rodentolepis nana TaxID=102285 RepID=A0A3P7V4U7_RODNA|nr:unnamed protein product [Rodentolepis nana]